MDIQNYEYLLQAVAQAAIEAHIMLSRFALLHEYTITVRTEKCGFDVTINRNHQVKVSSRTAED